MENFNPNQMTMISLDQLVSKNHQYRKLLNLLNFSYLCKPIKNLNNDESVGRTGYDIVTLFKCIFLQFLEDLSDRQLAKHLQISLEYNLKQTILVYFKKYIKKNKILNSIKIDKLPNWFSRLIGFATCGNETIKMAIEKWEL